MERQLIWPGGPCARVHVVPGRNILEPQFNDSIRHLAAALDESTQASSVLETANDALASKGLSVASLGMTATTWYLVLDTVAAAD